MKFALLIILLTVSASSWGADPIPVIFRDSNGRGKALDRPNPEEVEAILTKAFGPHLRRQESCLPDPGNKEQARKAGQFVPVIISTLHGSFTARSMVENLHVVFMGECGAGHADDFGSRRLLVFRNNVLLTNIEYPGTSGLNPIDLDDNGQNEWVMTSSFCNQGDCAESASIVRLMSNQITTVYTLGTTYEDSCAAPGEIGKKEWTNVTWFQGKFTRTRHGRSYECK